MSPVTTTTAPTTAAASGGTVDPALVDAARAALTEEVGPGNAGDVGRHLGQVAESEDGTVSSQLFACERAGYVGWHWSVTVVHLADGPVTVDEVVLIPGDAAIVAPPWLPYRDRIRPGDLSPGDLLPVSDEDPRLVPTYAFGDDPLDPDAKAQIRQVAKDLGLGRVRTLGPVGHDLAAQRWYAGPGGPGAPIAQSAPDHCHSCGFLVRLGGSLAESFGVCGNGDANDDGRVVSMDHGCGAHSEVRLAKKHEPQPVPEPVWDTLTPDEIELF